MLKTSQDILNEHDRRFTYGLLWYFLLETHDSDYGYSLMFLRENVPNEVIHKYLQKKFNKYILKGSQYNIGSSRMELLFRRIYNRDVYMFCQEGDLIDILADYLWNEFIDGRKNKLNEYLKKAVDRVIRNYSDAKLIRNTSEECL